MELGNDREAWNALLEAMHIAAVSGHPRELAERILQQLVARDTIAAGGVWLRDGEDLVALERLGFEQPPSPVQIHRVVEQGTPVFTESADVEQDGTQRARALAFLPLRAAQECIGALVLLSAGGHDEHERSLFEAIAAHLGLAFHALRGVRRQQSSGNAPVPTERDWELFLAHTAHEIKNPLASIKGYADLLIRRAPNDSADPYRKGLMIVSQQVVRTTSLLEQLSDMSRVGGDRLRLDRHGADLAEIVRREVDAERASTNQHEIRVRGAGEPVPIVCDVERIQQVIGAMLSNAIKFAPNGGRIDVRIERDGAGEAVVSVHDYGIGVPRGEEERVFERFYRGSNVAGSYRGLGVSLFVARAIAERHGGRMWIESTPDEGTACHLALPTERRSNSNTSTF
jgi:signal transduction histidine kinase